MTTASLTLRSCSSQSPAPQPCREHPTLSIDLTHIQTQPTSTTDLKERINMALATSDHTRTIKLAGLMGNPAVATRVHLILSSEEEVETMHRHDEWAKSYLPGLRIEG